MEIKRLLFTLRLCFIRSGYRRGEFAKRKGIYDSMGENVRIQSRKIPLYPELIRFHNNIQIASNVTFLTHDVIHNVFNGMGGDKRVSEKIGCIEIMDNVFIGSNSTILYDVKIGPNAIVAAGSVVVKDVPENSIVGGNPARVIGKFDDYKKRKSFEVDEYTEELKPKKQRINKNLARIKWNEFEENIRKRG